MTDIRAYLERRLANLRDDIAAHEGALGALKGRADEILGAIEALDVQTAPASPSPPRSPEKPPRDKPLWQKCAEDIEREIGSFNLPTDADDLRLLKIRDEYNPRTIRTALRELHARRKKSEPVLSAAETAALRDAGIEVAPGADPLDIPEFLRRPARTAS